MGDLKKLFEPISIGPVKLKNRFVMLAMGMFMGTPSRHVNDRVKAYHEERAKGGAGMIIVGILPVVNVDPSLANQIGISRDDHVPGLREIVKIIHDNGAKAFAQIGLEHYWRNGNNPSELVGPSSVQALSRRPAPRPMTIEDMRQMTQDFADAGRRAREAGFDGVEIHMGTGFILSLFLSTFSNKRTDEYGGTVENRARFPIEVIKAVRAKIGPDMALSCKMSAHDFMEGGNTLEEYQKVAPLLEKAGVQAINVAAGWHESAVPVSVAMVPQGGFAYLSEGIKKVVKIPVISGYRIVSPLVAADILNKNQADLIGMARALLCDPDLPNKVKAGLLDEVRPCIACCRCLDDALDDKTALCSSNARLGRELEYVIKKADKPKKVFVIGGGPGGMEAARVAALRGHQVTLFEKKDSLGGQLPVAAMPSYKREMNGLVEYFAYQMKNTGVKVRLGVEAGEEVILKEKPDAVIIATGAESIVPNIPGIRGGNVATAIDVLSGKKDVGSRVIIIGGGLIGCETAEYLLSKGKQITIVEMLDKIGKDIGASYRWLILSRLRKAGVRMEVKAKAEEINERGVVISRDGAKQAIESDNVVVAVGMRANNALVEKLQGKVNNLHVIGDASSPRRIREAVDEAFKVAKDL